MQNFNSQQNPTEFAVKVDANATQTCMAPVSTIYEYEGHGEYFVEEVIPDGVMERLM